METSYIYHAYGIKDFECTKTEYKGNTIIRQVQHRSTVRNSILKDLQKTDDVPFGKPFNRTINVSGYNIQYTVYKRIENGKYIYNIGRIHGK